MKNSLYIHIPFCRNICSYCDFCRVFYREPLVDKYIEKIVSEIPNQSFFSIYLGGGTPSCLSLAQTEKLLSNLVGKTMGEYTIECNVEDIYLEKLLLFKKYGINRLSIGVQSFDQEELSLCNRKYLVKDIYTALELVARHFNNYSIDLIYGLPNQTIKTWNKSLNEVKQLKIPHLSIYSLTIEENSIWGKNGYQEVDDELLHQYYLEIENVLNNYHHYEISNFAINGYIAKHNKVYWNNDDYLALGVNASGKQGNRRYINTSNIQEYLKNENNQIDEILTPEQLEFEYIMMNFRLDEGINKLKYYQRFNKDFTVTYQDVLYNNKDYFIFNERNIAIKKEYWFTINNILLMFIR